MKLHIETTIKYRANDETKNYIFRKLVKNNLTLTKLAKMNDISVGALSHYITGTRPFTAEYFNKVFKPIGLYIDEKSRNIKEIK